MERHPLIACALAPAAAVLVALGLYWDTTDADHPSAPHARLIESAGCGPGGPRSEAPRQAAPSTGPTLSAGIEQVVPVVVPRVALLQMDATGRLVAAATSTGCAPLRGDLVYIVRPDGSLTASHGFDLGEIEWRGDFRSPGEYQPQVAIDLGDHEAGHDGNGHDLAGHEDGRHGHGGRRGH